MKYSDDETTGLQKILDSITELIYIADCDTYELLYVNQSGREQFGIKKLEKGLKCHKVFQNQEVPCSFCTNKYLREDQDYIWENQNTVTDAFYRLKDRLIQWDGRLARMEIAFDITEVRREKEALQYALDTEKMVLECVRILNERREQSDNMDTMLSTLGSYLGAERVYIFENRNSKIYNTYEWCNEKIGTQKDRLQGISYSIFQLWEKEFSNKQCIVLEDVKAIENLELKQMLDEQGVKSLVLAPLEHRGKIIGYLGVDNPPFNKVRNIISLLETLKYFIALTIQKRADDQLLEHLSLCDTLTGLYNRNKYILDVERFTKEEGSFGIFYLDVNGLKEINDDYGHAYGDFVLMKCTEHMREVFGKANIYRTGGDEFIVICRLENEKQLQTLQEELKASFSNDTLCSVAIGCQWAKDPSSLGRYIEEADNLMYQDKKKYYEENFAPDSKRYRSARELRM